MSDSSSTYSTFGRAKALALPGDIISLNVLSLVVISILILLLSEGNILLGIIS